MELSVEHECFPVPVTVLSVTGKLDASNYEELIARGRALHAEGVRRLLIDFSGLAFMGSSGLVALHVITLMMLGERLPDPEVGWGTLKNLSHTPEPQTVVKLLNPPSRVQQLLTVTGMGVHYPVFSERAAALAAFAQG